MKLTKYQHACLVIEQDSTHLVIDPGEYSHDFIIPKHVAAIVITHNHPDHLHPALITQILEAHPKATVIGDASITAQYAAYTTIAVNPGQTVTVGPFALEFFGGQHAPIAEGIATPPNHGVLVNGQLYYPGDSFVAPENTAVDVLAIPISAPWLDFARTREFLARVHPRIAFPTHDGILSEDGKQLAEQMVGGYAQANGVVYKRLDGQSIEL